MAITYLSGERIQGSSEADIPLGDGLKAYWHLDESSGTTATNDAGEITGNSSIGTAGNLTLTDVTLAQSGSPTNFGTNADFDGSNSMGECGAGTEANFNFLHDGSDWSVSFWAKMDATGSNQHIIDNKGAVGDYENGLDIRTMTTARWRVVGTLDAGYYVIRNTTDNYIPDTTNFHHYVMTWDNSTTTVTFYRDGANKETGSGSSGASGTADEPLVICGHAYDSASTIAKTGTLNGKVCELAIWNTVLTDAQVSRIYNGGDGRLLTLAGVQDDKTTITNVPTGTRFEETDTRKTYRRVGKIAGTSGTGSVFADITRYNSENDAVSFDLGANLSDTQWTMRFKFVVDTITRSSSTSGRSFWGMSSADANTTANSNQDSICFGITYGSDSGEDQFRAYNSDGAAMEDTFANIGSSMLATGTWYVTINRTSATAGTVTVTTNSDYTTSTTSGSQTGLDATCASLRYFVVKTKTGSTENNHIYCNVQDVKIWNGTNSTSGTPTYTPDMSTTSGWVIKNSSRVNIGAWTERGTAA